MYAILGILGTGYIQKIAMPTKEEWQPFAAGKVKMSTNLLEERKQNRTDVFSNRIPKRVPIQVGLSLAVVADYAKIDRRVAYWDPSLLSDAIDELATLIPSDNLPYSGTIYSPVTSQTIDSIAKVMSSTGYMQHPNTVCMSPDEYDELIADPYAFIVDKCVPRLCKALDPEFNPGRFQLALMLEDRMKAAVARKEIPMVQGFNAKYGYPVFPGGNRVRAGMDWLADMLRSFSGVCIDIRRNRQQVLDALDSVYPLLYKTGLANDLNNIDRQVVTSFQLHMATYLREKDYLDFFQPTWLRQSVDYASHGMRTGAFLEHDWERLLDFVYDFPTGSYFTFEFTNPQILKDKLGKKHILGGGFPLINLTTCNKAQIIDKTKEWLDIMAPGGQYTFGFDKSALVYSDVNLENLIAMCETVRDYGVYDNAGQATGEDFNKEDYTLSEGAGNFKSKYYPVWEEYLEKWPYTPENAKEVIYGAEDALLSYFFALTC